MLRRVAVRQPLSYIRIKAGDVKGVAGDPSVIGEGPREAKQEKAKQEGLRGWIKSGTERRGLLARWRVRAGDVDGMQRPCAGRESAREQRGLAPGPETKAALCQRSAVLAARRQRAASEFNFRDATGLASDYPPRPTLSWGCLCSDHPAWLCWSWGLWAHQAGLPRACQA